MRRRVPADYGLHWPRGKTYIVPAILWGAFFGVAINLVGFAPEIIAHKAPELGYKLTTPNVLGWLFFEGIYVGPTEEIPFRALLVTYLATTMPGRVRLGRYEMNWAGVIVAVFFALGHANSFFTSPWPQALVQQVFAFSLGVLYAYWLEKSQSVIAPIIGHNMGDLVAQGTTFLWVWLAS
jgi:membrane protease YdiL (CAAX protease family)